MMQLDATPLLLLALALFITPRPDGERMQRIEFARGGFSIELPEGWENAVESDEAALPASATYHLRNTAAGPLAGAVVTVHRRANLNPLQRQQWMRGRAPLPLGALRPAAALQGAAMPFATGVGIRAEGGGRAALVYFTAHGPVHYAVVAEAPAGGFPGAEPALLAVARSIQFTGAAHD